MSFPFHYTLGTTGLEVRLGPFVVRRIPYWDIEAVNIGFSLLNEHWTNVWPFKFLTIRRKSGWLKNFVINPKDRESFVEGLRALVKGARR
ncbi:MAG: PH domain-containing protein [Elusimicrobia bacterium]|nr:PH domain-containing protein [Elusimicrobiota bacterium]